MLAHPDVGLPRMIATARCPGYMAPAGTASDTGSGTGSVRPTA